MDHTIHRLFVTGATGFVGQHVVQQLIRQGHHVTCLIRREEQKQLFQTLPQSSLRFVVGDLFQPELLSESMRSCDTVIHLVGIIREVPRQGITFQRIHVDGTRFLCEAAQNAGVQRFIHMSALGARANSNTGYHQTKYIAEQVVQASDIPYIIFRPSIIYEVQSPFVQQLRSLVQLPLTPVIGHGNYLLQPVALKTVASLFEKAVWKSHLSNLIFEVGGPEQVSFLQMLQHEAEVLNRKLRPVYLPLNLMELSVRMLQGIPRFPLTMTQLTMLKEGNILSEETPLYQLFDEAAVPYYS